jgi:hypothetical protein
MGFDCKGSEVPRVLGISSSGAITYTCVAEVPGDSKSGYPPGSLQPGFNPDDPRDVLDCQNQVEDQYGHDLAHCFGLSNHQPQVAGGMRKGAPIGTAFGLVVSRRVSGALLGGLFGLILGGVWETSHGSSDYLTCVEAARKRYTDGLVLCKRSY